MFIDVHCHLDMLENVDLVIDKARKNNVKIMVAQGVNVASNRKVLELAQKYPEIKAALGLYPIDSLSIKEKEIEAEFAFIRKNKKHVSAIGEVGLDLKEDKEQFTKQQRVFQQAIDASIDLDMPIIIHSRKAELQTIIQLEQSNAKKVIMHCFSGKLNLVKRIVENQWYLSIPTSVKNSEHFQKVIEITPIEQLFCETDSPYLHPDREFPNEPKNVIASYEMIAKIKKLKLVDVEKQIEKNYKELFTV